MSQKNDCPTPDNATNEDTVGSKLARRITGLKSILEENWLAAERADAEYRAEIKILRSDKSRRDNLEAGLMAGVVRLQDEVRRLEEVIAASQPNFTPVAWAVAIGSEGLVLDGVFLRQRDADEACAWRNEHTEYGARLIPLCALLSRTGSNAGKTVADAGESVDQTGKVPERERLTDEEREALTTAMHAYGEDNADEECAKIEATLYGLLKRLGDSPAANATPTEGSKQNGCTITDPRIGRLWSDQ